jgi:hypothetical protein
MHCRFIPGRGSRRVGKLFGGKNSLVVGMSTNIGPSHWRTAAAVYAKVGILVLVIVFTAQAHRTVSAKNASATGTLRYSAWRIPPVWRVGSCVQRLRRLQNPLRVSCALYEEGGS